MTLNVRGLRNPVKRGSIFCFLKDQNCEVYFLQETYSELSDEIVWRSKSGGIIFFSHGSTHSKGVCILINPTFNCASENLQKDQNGRIVSVDLNLNGSKFSLCNIYVPNDQRNQQVFLQDLSAYLMSNTDTERLVVGGDWNITLQSIDKKGGTLWKSTSARDKPLTMMNGKMEKWKTEHIMLKENLCLLYENKAKGAIIRSKTKWIEQGEKPNKYFFNLEKRNYNRKVIKSLKRPDGKMICNELELLKEIEMYYRNLYSSVIDRRNDFFEEFIENLEIPKLEDTVRDELEGEITLKECQDILRTFKREKSPGDDGFTWEFYNCFLICSHATL